MENIKKYLFILTCLFPVLTITGCKPDAEFSQTIIYEQINGKADRGAGNEQSYDKGGDEAKDRDVHETFSGSAKAKPDSLLGYVHAVPPPADEANTVQSDIAVATSFNKIRSRLVVNKKRNYTFDVKLELNNIEIKHNGKLEVNHSVTVMDTRGAPLKKPNKFMQNSYQLRNANGTHVVKSMTAKEKPTTGKNSHTAQQQTPSPGIELDEGVFWVQIELNLTATAPTAIEDGKRSEAHINEGILTVSIK